MGESKMALVRDVGMTLCSFSYGFQGGEAHAVPLDCYLSNSESMVLGPLPQQGKQ